MIRVWKGYHSSELLGLIQKTWESNQLLILCPPLLKDLGFLDLLPEGEIEFCGDWGGVATEIKRNSLSFPEYPEKPVLGVFTSGTISGNPKLILYSKNNIKISLDSIIRLFDRTRITKVFCYPQPFHTFGLLLGYVLSHLYRFELIVENGRYSSQFHKRWMELNIKSVLTLGAPTHFLDLMAYVAKTQNRLVSTYSCIVGGAPVSVQLWKDLKAKLCIEAPSIGYGATEACPGISHLPPGVEPTQEGELGYPFENLNIAIETSRGLRFSGESVCLAIIQNNQIEFPHEILIKDQIEAEADGRLIYKGRVELSLNRGGEKLSLERVEKALTDHLGFEALCSAVPHSRLGQDLGILLKGPVIFDDEPVKAQIRELLSRVFGMQFDLDSFTSVSEFPLNLSSKIDRNAATQILFSKGMEKKNGQ